MGCEQVWSSYRYFLALRAATTLIQMSYRRYCFNKVQTWVWEGVEGQGSVNSVEQIPPAATTII